MPALASSDIGPDLLRSSRRAWRALDTVHVVGYFAPETTQAYVDLGLRPRLAYFAARSACFGHAQPDVVVATFYVFAPGLVHKALPSAWETVSPERLVQARFDGVGAALRPIVGEPDLAEALGIAREVCAGLSAYGRPLYAAHASLPWPEDDLLALWHAATLIREHRGDGHVSLLHAVGVDPVEASVLGGLYSSQTAFVRATRGWSDEEWGAAETRLCERGWLGEDGALSDAGQTARQEIEDATDALAVEGWSHVGQEATERLHELTMPLSRAIIESGLLSKVRG